jgi:hypothetical protein
MPAPWMGCGAQDFIGEVRSWVTRDSDVIGLIAIEASFR